MDPNALYLKHTRKYGRTQSTPFDLMQTFPALGPAEFTGHMQNIRVH